MKNILLSTSLLFSLSCLSYNALAQAGAVYTVAGGGTSTADGIPATTALLYNTTGVGVDGAGNVYLADRNFYVIRKIDAATGLIYNVAGTTSVSGFSGDGMPATATVLSTNIRGIHVTPGGDIYISDNSRIRKVTASTGIISTVAGGGSSSADGIPATDASLGGTNHVFVDVSGNIYVGTNNKIKRVNATTGIITTIAGGGSSTADGVPATNALMSGAAKSICMDNAGNLYIIAGSMSEKIRKIDAASGIITTVAGGGTSTAEGIPATNMQLADVHTCRVDGAGNIFIADWNRGLIRRVDAATGIVNTIAGATSGGSSADGTPALAANVSPYMIWIDPPSGYIYYSDFSSKIKRLSYSPMVPLSGTGGAGPSSYSSDSFYVNVHKQCSGSLLTVRTHSYRTGLTVRTDFGDGILDTSVIAPSLMATGGYLLLNHPFSYSGTYPIKHILCDAGMPIDSFNYSYSHTFCSDLSVRYYNDADLDCARTGSENLIIKPITTQIDSNGVPVDTIMCTSGFNYLAYGTPGDIYTFKIISSPLGLYPSCPATGIFYDTLYTGVLSNTTRWAGLSCTAGATSDLAATAYIPVTGPNDQWGRIYVRNNYCMPTDASVTINFSPKYRYTGGANPTPASSTATSLTWNLNSISSTDDAPREIYYVVWHNPAVPYPADGDTANMSISVTATSGTGDIYLPNNEVIRVDTVRTSCDPNAIEVSPTCFDNDTTFHFTVHFENIGSAPAENIYVMDTLSDHFDPATMQIEMSTHTMFTSKFQANGRTIYKFNFPNINLADSSDHVNRDGAFMYTIKNRPGMAMGTSALSRVGIYFDYNDVLMTNTVYNTKGCPEILTGITHTATTPYITLFPNPATNELTISTEQNIFTSLTITNTIGQQVLSQAMHQPQVKVNVAHLPAGIYYVTLKGEQGSQVRKFVKW